MINELLAFMGLMALGQFSPGPDMVLLTRTALAGGARNGVLMAAGIATGLMVHSSIAAMGVAVFLTGEGGLALALRLLAGCYLLFLAWQIMPKGQGNEVRQTEALEVPRPYWRGLLCNLLNPKAALFLAAMMAPFTAVSDSPQWPWILAAIIVVQGGVLWSLWAVLLQRPGIRGMYQRSAKWIDRLFALALLVLGVSLFFLS